MCLGAGPPAAPVCLPSQASTAAHKIPATTQRSGWQVGFIQFPGSNLVPGGAIHIAVWGAVDHTVNTLQIM